MDATLIDAVYGEGYWRSQAAKDRGYTTNRADQPLYLRTYRRRLAVVRATSTGPVGSSTWAAPPATS